MDILEFHSKVIKGTIENYSLCRFMKINNSLNGLFMFKSFYLNSIKPIYLSETLKRDN